MTISEKNKRNLLGALTMLIEINSYMRFVLRRGAEPPKAAEPPPMRVVLTKAQQTAALGAFPKKKRESKAQWINRAFSAYAKRLCDSVGTINLE